MTGRFARPPIGFGPGSQQSAADDALDLNVLVMPAGMRTFERYLPELDGEAAAGPALAVIARIAEACEAYASTGAPATIALAGLDGDSRRIVSETLGEGEVAARVAGRPPAAVQESVYAGVWAIRDGAGERIEVAPIPSIVAERAFLPQRPAAGRAAVRAAGVVNAPAIVTELLDRAAHYAPGEEPHVVNLSLLPHTPEDLTFLETAFGVGSVTLLSRGYGSCRVAASAVRNVWRVRFFNSMDALILDTLEVSAMPQVVIAASEDIADSASRLRDVLGALQ